MTKKYRICLSISAMDESFAKMAAALSGIAEVAVVGLDGYSLRDTDIFIGKKMSADKLKDADDLKAVFAYKTGVDDFPVREFAARGIILANSHVNSRSIAQYAFSLAVTLVSRTAEFDRKMRLGNWTTDNPYWRSLFSMKAGLAGFGHIGREIYSLLAANGIKCYTTDRGKEYPDDILLVNSLHELCKASDILFVSLPKTPSTDNLFGKELFGLLKGKYIVNVGRSNCIDEAALFEALANGGMGGAAIDTWREKPASADELLLPFDVPFQTLDNILLSSHKAMQVSDGHARYVEDTLNNVLRYLNGALPDNIVDCRKGY